MEQVPVDRVPAERVDNKQMQTSPHSHGNDAGFTLVELVVVTVLLALMASILYGTLTGIMGGRQIIESEREVSTTALTVLDSITRDLTARALVPLRDPTSSSGSSSGSGTSTGTSGGTAGVGFGTTGLGGQARGYFFGENKQEGESDADFVRFVANELPGDSPGTPANYGYVEISYRLVEVDRNSIPEDFQGKGNMYQLVREETPADVQEEEITKTRSYETVIADRVAGFNVRYLKDGTWEKTWKSSPNPVPEAVEITLSMFASNGDIQRYRTAVAISKRAKQRSGTQQTS